MFREIVESWEASLKPRDYVVVVRRFSAAKGDRKTLQDLAMELDLSRQRVQQIEVRLLKSLRRALAGEMEERVRSALGDCGGAAAITRLEVQDQWFEGLAEYEWVLKTLMKKRFLNGFSMLSYCDFTWLVAYRQKEWKDLLKAAESAVNAMLDRGGPMRLSDASTQVSVLVDRDHAEAAKVLSDLVLGDAVTARVADGATMLVSPKRTVGAILEAVLLEAGRPLHYSDIYERACTDFGYTASERAVHNACAASGLILLGRGIFGLREHLRIPASVRDAIAFAIEDLVASGSAERQWHAYEFLDAVVDIMPSEPDESTVYEIAYIAQTHSEGIEYVGRMVFAGEGGGARGRIDVRQAVVSILRSAEGPLREVEILARLRERRGMSNFSATLQPSREYARMRSGKIGLIERDFGIDLDQDGDVLGTISRWCHDEGVGLHRSEIPNVLRIGHRDVTDYCDGVLAMARGDTGLRVSPAGYLYPSAWNGPNRLSIAEALDMVIEDACGLRLTLQEIVEQVQTRTQRRDINPMAVSSLLSRSSRAEYDRSSARWECS